MSRRGACWRAELAYLLHARRAEAPGVLALPFELPSAPVDLPADLPSRDRAGGSSPADQGTPAANTRLPRYESAPVPVWRALTFRPIEDPARAIPGGDVGRLYSHSEPIPGAPLVPWPRFWSRVDRVLRDVRVLRELAVDRAVELVSRGAQLASLPRRARRSLPTEITIVVARDAAHAVLEVELERLCALLGRRLGQGARRLQLQLGPVGGGESAAVRPRGGECPQRAHDWRVLARGTVLLVGDLGVPVGPALAAWLHAMRPLLGVGRKVALLTPCPVVRLRSFTQLGGRVIAGDALSAPENAAAAAQRLVALLYVAARFDLTLLRQFRTTLAEPGMTAEAEVALLRNPRVRPTGTGSYALVSSDIDAARRAWAQLRQRDPGLALRSFALVRDYQARFSPLLGAEVLLRGREVVGDMVTDQELEAARATYRLLARAAHDRSVPLADQHVREVLRSGGAPDAPTREVLLGVVGARAVAAPRWLLLSPRDRKLATAAASPVAAVGAPANGSIPLGLVASSLETAFVLATEAEAGDRVRLANGSIVLPKWPGGPFALRTDRGTWTFAPTVRPAWASAFGCDEFGVFADLEVAGVRQRMRWIPPGEFTMGSPEDEPGRLDDEGPQRLVAIEHGFWLADTPCTQAMWLAVVGGKNPSRFETPERPVEHVSWEDVQMFVQKLTEQNRGDDGLEFRLPWEDEWEYAARAGTTTASYAGPVPIEGENKAPALDPVAWYGGNSGTATHPVGQKAPNALGLQDMLGNVWEWCQDPYGAYPEGQVADWARSAGVVGSYRVIRGGSWYSFARFCRSAQRFALLPGNRWIDHGFRLARGQVRAPGQQEPEQASKHERGGAGRGTRSRPPREGR